MELILETREVIPGNVLALEWVKKRALFWFNRLTDRQIWYELFGLGNRATTNRLERNWREIVLGCVWMFGYLNL